MKTGIIVYVVGESQSDYFDVKEVKKSLPVKADRVEIISDRSGHFDIMDAWWLLTTKEMNRVICVAAEATGHSKLKLTGQELRLCG